MLKPTHVSFEYLRDKRANIFLLVWRRVRYWYQTCPVCAQPRLIFCCSRVGSSGVPTMVGSSDNDREFRRLALNWLRWFTVLVIPDVSGMDYQRPTTSFQMPWGSRVPMWVGSSDGRKFRHASGVPTPHKLQLSYLVFKYAEGQEFRRESGVPTVGSSGIHQEFRHLTLSL